VIARIPEISSLSMFLRLFLLLIGGAQSARIMPGARPRESTPSIVELRPTVVAASHNLTGYAPERAVDGNDRTYWLVAGGQRMEAMSRDKWLVFDLGSKQTPSAISLLGLVDSFGGARVLVDAAPSEQGPWRRVGHLRALKSLKAPERMALPAKTGAARFFRIYIRREGHATFRHAIHDVVFHCDPAE